MDPKPTRQFAALAMGLASLCAPATAHESQADGPARTCLAPAAWMTLDGRTPRPAAATAVLAEMARQDVVLLGEHHDRDDDHRWQVQALAALQAQRPHMVIGFEMFPRRVQPVLDRWVQGQLTVKEFLQQTEWDKVWNVPAELYLPLFQFARINRIPMVALNVDVKLNRAIVEKGWDQVPEAEREGVGRPLPPSDAYRNFLLEAYQAHAAMAGKDTAKATKSDRAFRNFVESQTLWDRAMAEALAGRLQSGAAAGKPLVVGIMGGGHIRYGYGVPHQLRDLGVKKIGTLIPMAADSDCRDIRAGLADAVFALPKAAVPPPEPPRLGVTLEQVEDGVRIADVMADSLAEKSGLKSGDHLLEIAGMPATQVPLVVASVRQQPGGSWLPLRIRRGDETVEVIVKFPVKP